jgi:hypothetical protein
LYATSKGQITSSTSYKHHNLNENQNLNGIIPFNLIPRRRSYEDKGRDEKALVRASHMTTQNMDIFDSYSSRSGKIFLTENYILVFETNKQPKHFSIDIIYV